MALVCGIDEAGRGPVIGPLVVCGVLFTEEKAEQLAAMGAKDSKLLSPQKRERLFSQIQAAAERVELILLSPEEIDAAVLAKDSSLNELETAAMASAINRLRPDKAYIDCPSTNVAGWLSELRRMLDFTPKEIIAEHKADAKYPLVGAASILAKVTRDREIEALKAKFHVDFGSGYPADPKTKAFIEKHYRDFPFFRKSWETYRRIAEKDVQGTLDGFGQGKEA